MKEEVYNVKIGVKNGFKEFFRVNTLNNRTYFPQQKSLLEQARRDATSCPILVENSFDNSLFPPFMTPDTPIDIVAIELCRTLKAYYEGPETFQGLNVYRYTFTDPSHNIHRQMGNCLNNSMGIQLPAGIFDTSNCMFSKSKNKAVSFIKLVCLKCCADNAFIIELIGKFSNYSQIRCRLLFLPRILWTLPTTTRLISRAFNQTKKHMRPIY